MARDGTLFVEVDSALQATGQDHRDPGSVRHRMVTVDASRLSEVRDDVQRNGESTLTLNLFDDVLVSAVLDQTQRTSTGYSLGGRIRGTALGSVTLVVNSAAIAGTVRLPEATYTIRSVGRETLAVRQIDSLSLGPDEPSRLSAEFTPVQPHSADTLSVPATPSSAWASPASSTIGSEDGSRIDVMVVYTAGAREDAGGVDGIEAEIDLRVVEMNQAFVNSGVRPRIHLVWTAEVDYEEVPRDDRSGGANTIDHLRDPSDGYMDEVHLWRDRYAADLVHLIVDRRFTSCGEAKRLRDPSSQDAASRNAFTISRIINCDSLAFAHELGHSMGLAHDRYAEINRCCAGLNRVYPYSHGFVNQRAFDHGAPASSRWRTIMAYDAQCRDAGFPGWPGDPLRNRCYRPLLFSNPDVSYNNDPAGVPGDESSSDVVGPADARRSLNEMAEFIANFRVARCRGRARGSVSCDRQALEAVFEATDGENWVEATNWNTDRRLEDWYGVATNASGRVARLDLSGNGLTGRLPLDVTNLTGLALFNISGTDACVPTTSPFQTWRAGVPRFHSRTCMDPMAVDLGERVALEALYDDTAGDRWANKANWRTDAPVRDWFGVNTVGGHVASLHLNNNRLAGALPSELATLTRLRALELRGNSLAGSMPALGALIELELLELSGNGLTGPLPRELGNLKRLTRIGLSGNNLAGPIPPEYGGLVSLSRLYLSGNDLTGSIPVELGNLTSLTAVYLNGNGFTGPIPPELGNLDQLLRLSLANNSLSGSIPPQLGNLSRLTLLRLDRNNLAGPIPLELTRLVNLTEFSISETNACVPAEPAFEVWLSGIEVFRGRRCERRALTFTDDPIVPGATPVRAVHFTELRLRIDVLRRKAGLAPFRWTDPVLLAGVARVKLVHLTELRSALADAFVAAGRAAPRWTDPALAAGATPIRALHLTELRAAVLALE